jgi:hypothetical protein
LLDLANGSAIGKAEIERMKEKPLRGNAFGQKFRTGHAGGAGGDGIRISGLPDLHAFINGANSTYESSPFSAPASMQ